MDRGAPRATVLGVTKIHKEDPPSFLRLHYILLCEETNLFNWPTTDGAEEASSVS